MPISVYRPLASDKVNRIAIKMPYQFNNRELLKLMLGESIRPTWDKQRQVWLIARSHYPALLRALSKRSDVVTVIEDYVNQSFCRTQCQQASELTEDLCECSCLGAGHGGGPDHRAVTVGDLVIYTDRKRRTRILNQKDQSA